MIKKITTPKGYKVEKFYQEDDNIVIEYVEIPKEKKKEKKDDKKDTQVKKSQDALETIKDFF